MKGKELWEQYQHYTRDFTEHARTLGVGAIGACWLFKTDDFKFPSLIIWALLLVVLYFLFDVLQSLVGALILKRFTEREEKRLWETTNSIEGDIPKPLWVDKPAFVCFSLKALFLSSSFILIGGQLLNVLSAR